MKITYKSLSKSDKRQIRLRAIITLKRFNYEPPAMENSRGVLKNKTVATLKNKDLFEAYRNLIKSCPLKDYIQYRDLNKVIKEFDDGFIYIISDFNQDVCKIGYSLNPVKRLSELQTGYPHKLVILHTFKGTIKQEKALHKKYKEYNTFGEWFRIEGDLKKAIESIKI